MWRRFSSHNANRRLATKSSHLFKNASPLSFNRHSHKSTQSRVQAGTALAGKTSQALQSWPFSRSTASGRQLPEEDSRLKEEIREKLRKEQTVLKFVLRRIPAFLSDVQNLCPHTFLILFSSQLWSRLLEICPSGRTQIPFLGLGRDPAGLRSNKLGSVEAGSMRGKVEM